LKCKTESYDGKEKSAVSSIDGRGRKQEGMAHQVLGGAR